MKRLTQLLGIIAVVVSTTGLLTGCRPNNRPPENPAVPFGPSTGRTSINYTFTASAIDPDWDDVRIRFDWGDGDTSAWSPVVECGTSVRDSHAWTVADTFLIRAQAIDTAGLVTAWSEPHPFIAGATLNNPPRTPKKPAGTTTAFIGRTNQFTFVTTDLEDDAIAYQVDWGDGDTSAWTDFLPSGTAVTLVHEWQTAGPQLVRVRARDVFGASAKWSAPLRVGVSSQGTPRWKYPAAGLDNACPAVAADGTVYYGGPDGLYAVNPDGTLKWTSPVTVTGSPAIGADGTVYCTGTEQDSWYLYAFTNDGTRRWRFATARETRSSPAVAADSTVFFGSPDGYVYALNPDGTVKWRYLTGVPLWTAPALGPDRTIYVGSADSLFALSPDGGRKWCVPGSHLPGPFALALAGDGTIYFTREDNSRFYLCALKPDGTNLWQFEIGYAAWPPALGTDGTIYIGTLDGYLYAIKPNGYLKWRLDAAAEIIATPAVTADGTVLFGTNANYFYAVLSDGTVKWRWRSTQAIRPGPATVGPDNTIYFAGENTPLHALRGVSRLAPSPWPKFQRDAKNTGNASTSP